MKFPAAVQAICLLLAGIVVCVAAVNGKVSINFILSE